MASTLKIVWDGNVPGLAEHRLSVGEFGYPLTLLLTALRRIASQMVGSAVEGEHAQTGRFALTAKNIDMEIVSLEEGSAGVNAELVFRQTVPIQVTMFGDLLDRATDELLNSLDRESKGQWVQASVRNYLQSLPKGLTRQRYEYQNTNRPPKTVEITDVTFTLPPPELPFLREVEGSVIGVGFEPGKNEVRIKSEKTGVVVSANATEDAVDLALTLRGEKVRSFTVHQGKTRSRLISLKHATEPSTARWLSEGNRDTAKEHIFKRWAGLLERLAK